SSDGRDELVDPRFIDSPTIATDPESHHVLSLRDPQDPVDLTLQFGRAFVEAQRRGAVALPSHTVDGIDHGGPVALQNTGHSLRELLEIGFRHSTDPREVALDAVQLPARAAEVHRKKPQ